MICPKCGSQNVAIQVVNEVKLKNAHHGCLWWLIIGWWWIPIKWIFLTFPALLAKIFIPNRQKAVNKTVRKAVCQTCGNMWSFTNSDMKREIGNRNSMAQITVEDSIDPVDNNENALYSAEKTSQTNSLPEKETLQNESYFSEITKPITSFNLNSITDYFRDNKTFPQWPVNQNSIFDKFAAWIDNFVFNSDYRITTDKVLIVALISNVLGFHRVYSGRKISTILGWILLLFSFFSRDIALFLLLPWLIVDFIRISLGNYGRLKTNQKADFRKVKDHFLNKTLTKNTAIILSVSLLSLLYVLLFSPKTDTSKSNVTVSQTDIVVSNSDNNDDAIDVTLTVTPKVNDENGSVLFGITTNLPEDTVLMVTVSNDNFIGQDKATILSSGTGYTAEFSNKGKALKGTYTVSVSMSLPRLQKDSVRQIIGEKGEKIKGQYVYKSDISDENVVSAEFEFEF